MSTPIKKLNPVEVYRAIQEFADEEIETLLLLMDKDLTQEIHWNGKRPNPSQRTYWMKRNSSSQKHSLKFHKSVTSNITCSPTYTLDAAVRIKEILKNVYAPGIYHVTNSGFCSWYEFAVQIFRQAGVKTKVRTREEKEESEGVFRPLYSALASSKLPPMRHYKKALSVYLEERPEKNAHLTGPPWRCFERGSSLYNSRNGYRRTRRIGRRQGNSTF